jgi:hypothetical protein
MCCCCRYVTFTLLSVAELSAQLMTAVIADKAGRHVILSCGLLVSGTPCLACSSTTHTTARAALAVIGKYGCTGEQQREEVVRVGQQQ